MTDEKGVNHVSAPALNMSPFQFLNVQIKYSKLPFAKPKNLKIDGQIREAL